MNVFIEEILIGKDWYFWFNVDFDNYRKWVERDCFVIVGNIKGEVIESLLFMVDNFERVKIFIKIEIEGEVKIDNSY